MRRLGASVLETEHAPSVLSYASVVGKKEAEGPLGGRFDQTVSDSYLGSASWEKAEARLQNEAANLALSKGNLTPEEVDLMFAGDLLNQCISSTFGARSLNIPYLGQYGACSTMAQTLLLAAAAVDSGAASRALAVTSSHFSTAERQFRLPMEYGGQRTPTAQWTATASGAVVVGSGGRVVIPRVAPGRIVDLGVTDPANMGAAMAPAAADTILSFLRETGADPGEFDGIFTGDLGLVGSRLLKELLEENGVSLGNLHRDCGVMLYDIEGQDVHAGGSGCGCSAAVLCGYLLKELEQKTLRRVLFCATGALMSTTSSQQGESIPGICHLVELAAAEQE